MLPWFLIAGTCIPHYTWQLLTVVHCLCVAAKSGSSLHVPGNMEGELEGLVQQLSQGSAEERGLAAEKLFNKAAEDESARQKAAAVGVIQPLVSWPSAARTASQHQAGCMVQHKASNASLA